MKRCKVYYLSIIICLFTIITTATWSQKSPPGKFASGKIYSLQANGEGTIITADGLILVFDDPGTIGKLQVGDAVTFNVALLPSAIFASNVQLVIEDEDLESFVKSTCGLLDYKEVSHKINPYDYLGRTYVALMDGFIKAYRATHGSFSLKNMEALEKMALQLSAETSGISAENQEIIQQFSVFLLENGNDVNGLNWLYTDPFKSYYNDVLTAIQSIKNIESVDAVTHSIHTIKDIESDILGADDLIFTQDTEALLRMTAIARYSTAYWHNNSITCESSSWYDDDFKGDFTCLGTGIATHTSGITGAFWTGIPGGADYPVGQQVKEEEEPSPEFDTTNLIPNPFLALFTAMSGGLAGGDDCFGGGTFHCSCKTEAEAAFAAKKEFDKALIHLLHLELTAQTQNTGYAPPPPPPPAAGVSDQEALSGILIAAAWTDYLNKHADYKAAIEAWEACCQNHESNPNCNANIEACGVTLQVPAKLLRISANPGAGPNNGDEVWFDYLDGVPSQVFEFNANP